MLSALPARLRIDDTQAYIGVDCKRGNPVSALGVGGYGLWKKIIVAHTLGLVCLVTCINKIYKKHPKEIMEDQHYPRKTNKNSQNSHTMIFGLSNSRQALQILNTAYSSKNLRFPVRVLSKWLVFDSDNDTIEYFELCGLEVNDRGVAFHKSTPVAAEAIVSGNLTGALLGLEKSKVVPILKFKRKFILSEWYITFVFVQLCTVRHGGMVGSCVKHSPLTKVTPVRYSARAILCELSCALVLCCAKRVFQTIRFSSLGKNQTPSIFGCARWS